MKKLSAWVKKHEFWTDIIVSFSVLCVFQFVFSVFHHCILDIFAQYSVDQLAPGVVLLVFYLLFFVSLYFASRELYTICKLIWYKLRSKKTS